MSYQEKKLSKYIDQLNEEKRPKDHGKATASDEYRDLLNTVRSVKALKEPVFPDKEFSERLLIKNKTNANHKVWSGTRMLMTGIAAAAAVTIIVTSFHIPVPFQHTDIVYAMEQAIKEVHAYHGIIEVVETNEQGEEMTQSRREVWADRDGNYYMKELEGFSQDQVTANNGQKKWQLRPSEKEGYVFPAFPDPYRSMYELGNEVEDVKKALSVKQIGEAVLSGRDAIILEVTPDGGAPYHLWVDKETDLPLQKETAMQNALQTRITYTEIDFMDAIPADLLTFQLPKGYSEVNTDPEQYVNSLEESEEIAGFAPKLPVAIPEGYELSGISVLTGNRAVRFYYSSADHKNTVVIQQYQPEEAFSPASGAILGTIHGSRAEILTAPEANSIRWQEAGMEYKIFGNITIEELGQFAKDLTEDKIEIPKEDDKSMSKPQVVIPVDLTAERNEQKSVDAGHSPWKLDPVFVTQVFASLLISPEGIVGDYPIAYDDIKIISNNGSEAVAEIDSDNSIAKTVYLKRLVRKDDTGIWSVVGYDLAK